MRLTVAAVLVLIGCNDPTAGTPVAAPLLQPPPAGQGYQVEFGPFQVAAGQEVQLCRTVKLPNDEPIAVDRLQVQFTTGSHHYILFRSEKDFPDNVFPCWGTVNFDDWDFMLDVNKSGGYDWQLPNEPGDREAFVLQPHQQIMIQSHYVNATSVSSPDGGHSFLNLYTVPTSAIDHEVRGLFTVNTHIMVPPHSTYTTPWKKCTPSSDIQIVAMTGHFHARGTMFGVDALELGGGAFPDVVNAPLYYDGNWDAPLFKTFLGAERQYAMVAAVNQALRFRCSYDNTNPDSITFDTTIGFGSHADVQEHCNLFFQYYRLDKKSEPVTCVEGSGGW